MRDNCRLARRCMTRFTNRHSGLASGLIEEGELEKTVLWKWAKKRSGAGRTAKPEVRRYQIIRTLVNLQVTDLIRQSQKNFTASGVRAPDDAMRLGRFLVSFGSSLEPDRQELRTFLKDRLYRHYRVVRMSDKARRFIRALFRSYVERPEQLPPGSQKRLKAEGVHRVVCDYIAGMTDRYAQNEYRKLFEPFEKV